MRLLGISAFYHDSAAALVEDGHVFAAAQEERFTRKKHDAGFPAHAIRYCLDAAISTMSCFSRSH
jgi:carbamoyltransferase